MINFLQSNHHHSQSFCQMITNGFWDDIIVRISDNDEKDVYKYLDESCMKYNIDMSNLIKKLY